MKLSLCGAPKETWEIGPEFEIVKQIGSGSYGSVCEAIHKPSGRKVAIKQVQNLFEDKVDCKRVLREVQLLRMLDHQNIVKLFEILEPKDPKTFDKVYLVFEHAQSDIKKLVKSAIHLQTIHIQKLVYNMLVGLKYLHSSGVLHRDMKPANVLINEDCSVKIADFGLARSIAGVEGASLCEMKHPGGNAAEEYTAASDDEDVKIVNAKLAQINMDDSKPEPSSAGLSTASSTKLFEEDKKKVEEHDHKAYKQKQVVKLKEMRRNMKRQLTGHVVTRWYRAPEIILLEKDYGPAIDVWSVGCIFAELLSMIKENAPTYQDRKPLFPGASCFPLSPDHKITSKKHGFPYSHTDQLHMIFDILGSPAEEDCSFVTDAKAIEYLKTFSGKKRVDFSLKYPAAGPEGLDLLNKLLVFNPFFRMTVDQCLKHPYFAPVRDVPSETSAKGIISLKFEAEGEIEEKRLRELFLEEINYYKKKRKEGGIGY